MQVAAAWRQPPPPRFRGELLPDGEVPPEDLGPARVSVYSDKLSPSAQNGFLVSAWVRCDERPSSDQGFAAVVGKYNPGDLGNCEWLIGVASDGHFYVEGVRDGIVGSLTAPNAIQLSHYYHVCAAWHAPGGGSIYIDGQLAAQGDLERPDLRGLPMTVGDTYSMDGSHALKGAIDELKIWHKAADEGFIASLYASAPDTDHDGVNDWNDPDGNNDGIDDDWAQAYFGDRFAEVSNADSDSDGMSDRDEALVRTDPHDAGSAFFVWDAGADTEEDGVEFEWDGVSGRTYCVRSSPTLSLPSAMWTDVVATIRCETTGVMRTFLPMPEGDRSYYRVVVSKE